MEESKYISPSKNDGSNLLSQSARVGPFEPSMSKGATPHDMMSLKGSQKQLSQSQVSISSSNQTTTSVRSKDDIITQDEDEERKTGDNISSTVAADSTTQVVSDFVKQTKNSDAAFEQKMQQQKLKVAMRRNILKRNLSEDLDWAQELQSNPNYDLMRYIGSEIN